MDEGKNKLHCDCDPPQMQDIIAAGKEHRRARP